MKDLLEEAIRRQAIKLLKRTYFQAARVQRYRARYETRTGQPAIVKPQKLPGSWSVAKQFDPRYCLSHSRYFARVLWQKILDGTYAPQPAILYPIAKDDGGTRDIMMFSVPDAAVANLFHKRITARNLNLLSAHCYSYRPDRNIFDAILQVRAAITDRKVYVIQYDFSKYFDSIDHNYIEKIINDRDAFLITKAERRVVSQFLRHKFATKKDYAAGNFKIRNRGVPQGSSLSLILSNVAAHELDKALEISNGQFVRFADDVLAMTHSYDDALKVTEIFVAHCERSGIAINHNKSKGIKRLDGRKGIPMRRFFVSSGEGDRSGVAGSAEILFPVRTKGHQAAFVLLLIVEVLGSAISVQCVTSPSPQTSPHFAPSPSLPPPHGRAAGRC